MQRDIAFQLFIYKIKITRTKGMEVIFLDRNNSRVNMHICYKFQARIYSNST